MEERKIALFTEPEIESELAKKNKRDLIIGIVLYFIVIILLAKLAPDTGVLACLLMSLLFVGIPYLRISERNNKYNATRTQRSIEALVSKYGDYSLKIDGTCIDFMTFLFPASQVLVINGTKFNFSEIIDFSLNEMASYKTTTSTSSILGRGLVGGMMFGGIGALAGANSASSKTVKENTQYNFNIVLDDFNNPNFGCTYHQEDKANTLYSILKLIIDKNQKKIMDRTPLTPYPLDKPSVTG